MRALIPAFTVFISYAWLRKTFSVRIHAAIVIMFIGVFVYAAKGELDYTYFGLTMTLLGGFFSALKGVVTNVFLVGPLKLPTLQLLKIMSFYSGMSSHCLHICLLMCSISCAGGHDGGRNVLLLLLIINIIPTNTRPWQGCSCLPT